MTQLTFISRFYSLIKDFFRRNMFYFPFALLFGLIPYRFFGVFHLDYTYRLTIGLFFFLLFLFTMQELVTILLNNIVVQLLFFYLLAFEDFVRGMAPFYQYSFLFSFSFSLGGGPALTEDSMFWYILILFFFSFYRQMRDIFVNPQFEASSYFPLHVKKVEDLTWDLIVINMSSICVALFGQPIQNQLGKRMSQRSFNQISKRYVWGRVIGFAKTHPEAVTIVSSIAGGVGFTWGLYNQKISEANAMLRHKEQMHFQKIAEENLMLRHKEQMHFQKIAEENLMLRHKEHMDLEKLKLTKGRIKDLSYRKDLGDMDCDEYFFFF
uniref:Uncharacterized protein n=1 Tax=Trachydiscus minutus TaxID=1032745 RepID=A0A140F2N0_9STRA|nr:hypothetical protein [Trachydiscus minutus]AML60664.1 hypothetical protein [Trachydiscus minutus]